MKIDSVDSVTRARLKKPLAFCNFILKFPHFIFFIIVLSMKLLNSRFLVEISIKCINLNNIVSKVIYFYFQHKSYPL